MTDSSEKTSDPDTPEEGKLPETESETIENSSPNQASAKNDQVDQTKPGTSDTDPASEMPEDVGPDSEEEQPDSEEMIELKQVAEDYHPKRKRFFRSKAAARMKWATITFLLAGSLALPLSPFVLPTMVRWRILGRIPGEDKQLRRQALAVVVHKVMEENDQAYAEGTLKYIHHPDQGVFVDVHQALVSIGLWSRDKVGDKAFYRWIDVMLSEKTEARKAAAEELCLEPDIFRNPELISRLEKLASDPSEEVRFELLFRLTGKLGQKLISPDLSEDELKRVATMIGQLSQDSDPETARLAWLYLGLFAQIKQPEALHKQAIQIIDDAKNTPVRKEVGVSRRWAHLSSGNGLPIGDELADHLIASLITANAVPSSEATLNLWIKHNKEVPEEDGALFHWRSLQALPYKPESNALITRVISHLTQLPQNWRKPPLTMMVKAAVHEYGKRLADEAALPPEIRSLIKQEPEVALAFAEGLNGKTAAAINWAEMPPVVKLHLLRSGNLSAEQLAPEDLLDLTSSEMAAWRDITVTILHQSLDKRYQKVISDQWMRNLNDETKMTGAMLAALGDVRPEAAYRDKFRQEMVDLTEHIGTYKNSSIKKVAGLALWIHGDSEAKGVDIPNERKIRHWLYQHDDNLWTTVLLGLFERDPILAMDYLLNPFDEKIEQRMDMYELLIQKRWWWVLKYQLPQDLLSPPPSLSLWADEAVQRFQIQLLREWYLINRARWQSSLQAIKSSR